MQSETNEIKRIAHWKGSTRVVNGGRILLCLKEWVACPFPHEEVLVIEQHRDHCALNTEKYYDKLTLVIAKDEWDASTPVQTDPTVDEAAIYGAVNFNEKGEARIGDWIQTYCKKKIHAIDLKPEDIEIGDISHALSLVNRFTGHTTVAYSVAEHSVRVARLIQEQNPGNDRLVLEALLHDASEAYIADIARPFKHLPEMAPYRAIERSMEIVIAKRFGLPETMSPEIKEADEILLTTEARDLMSPLVEGWHLRLQPLPNKIKPWSATVAKCNFMNIFHTFYHGE
jgi:hypothetical protein